jgi:hypothetical protein
VRLDADEEMVNAIRDEVTANERRTFNDAVFGVWERLYKLVENANTNLHKDKAYGERFRTEWYEHLNELAPILKGLNLSEDARLDEMADRLTNFTTTFDEKEIKQRWMVKDRAREEMNRIHSDLSAIFGPMAKEQKNA